MRFPPASWMEITFEVMGLRPVLGRLLTPGDDGPNATGAAVLTYRFWRKSLNSDPHVLGKTVRLESTWARGPRLLWECWSLLCLIRWRRRLSPTS